MVLCFAMAYYLIVDLLAVADEHTNKGWEGLPKRGLMEVVEMEG